jgi:hypothetical protein
MDDPNFLTSQLESSTFAAGSWNIREEKGQEQRSESRKQRAWNREGEAQAEKTKRTRN